MYMWYILRYNILTIMTLPAPEAALCYFYRKKGLVYEKINWIY